MNVDQQAIHRCIERCARARDWRGRWRAVNTCADALTRPFEPWGISEATAQAAGRIGAWLATQGLPPVAHPEVPRNS